MIGVGVGVRHRLGPSCAGDTCAGGWDGLSRRWPLNFAAPSVVQHHPSSPRPLESTRPRWPRAGPLSRASRGASAPTARQRHWLIIRRPRRRTGPLWPGTAAHAGGPTALAMAWLAAGRLPVAGRTRLPPLAPGPVSRGCAAQVGLVRRWLPLRGHRHRRHPAVGRAGRRRFKNQDWCWKICFCHGVFLDPPIDCAVPHVPKTYIL